MKSLLARLAPAPTAASPITIPSKSEEVVIHSPENEGPKDAKGRPVFKPIKREETKITLPMAMVAGGFSPGVAGGGTSRAVHDRRTSHGLAGLGHSRAGTRRWCCWAIGSCAMTS